MEWQKIIRDNERWLATYCALAKFTAWILILSGTFYLIGGVYIWVSDRYPHDPFLSTLIFPFTNGFLPGLLALVAAAFLRYLLNPEAKIEFFLTHGDKVLYLVAAVYLLRIIGMLANMPKVYTQFQGFWDALGKVGLVVVPNLLLPAAQILIAVGLAQGLRRMLAAIHDSKTLV